MAPATRQLAPALVTGTRANAESAVERKRRSADILDAVLAEEIYRLPRSQRGGCHAARHLRQITGDRGEASAAAVRGLVQLETTLDGRELFTAGFGRALDYADLPSDMLTGIDVYGTSAASRLGTSRCTGYMVAIDSARFDIELSRVRLFAAVPG